MLITYRRPALYPKQSKAIFHTKRYGLIEATTKAGKTFGALAWLVEQSVLGKPGYNYWWVAPVYGQTDIAYRRLKQSLPHDVYDFHDSKLRITARPNNTAMWFKSGEKADNLYGDDVYGLVVDEASRVREESWHALRSTLTATRGAVRAIGNVKGRHNWFYQLCRRAQSGDPDMEYHKITCWDAVEAGILSRAEIEDARRTLPENVFRELYLAEPSDDGGNPFGLQHIAACTVPALSTEPPRWWGIDLAKSVDWTVCIALDAKNNVCRFERWQSPWTETKSRIRRLVGDTPALVDSTGVGDAVLEDLQRDGLGNYEGFKFSQSSKQQLMEGLAVSIQQGEIHFPEGIIKQELEIFEYEYTRTGVRYSAPQGSHDDCVCSLALVNRHRTTINPNAWFVDYYLKPQP